MSEKEKGAGFKYREISEWILKKIQNGSYKYNTKIPSEQTLCRKFGMSRQTVRRAIKELTEEGYLRTEKGRGTFVVRQRNRQSHTIGVLMSYMHEYLFVDILRGVEEVLDANGFSMEVGITNNHLDKERTFLQRMVENDIAGLIIEGTRSALPNPNVRYLQQLQDKGIPIVFIHNRYLNFPCLTFVMDDEALSYKMTEMLIKAGHKQIAGIFKGDDLQGVRRYKGYVDALCEYGIPIDESRIGWFYENYYANQKLDMIVKEILELFNSYTAVICYNDFIAKSVCDLLSIAGVSVPDDISIVSFDNLIIADQIAGGLTSAAHPRKLLGIEAATNLVYKIEYEDFQEDREEILETDIVVRNSIKEK